MICGTADGLSFPFDSESCLETQADLEPLIKQFDAECRLDLALYPPPISITAAIWALKFIENACRFLVYRELDEHLIADRLGPACPVPVSPACIYSVDLLMRYLPDVTRMAKGVGEDDPLVKHLQRAAARWPLSSVGMCGVICECDSVEPILSDPSLCQLYADRIVERRDISRLAPVAVQDAILIALGDHSSLASEISNAVEKYQERN